MASRSFEQIDACGALIATLAMALSASVACVSPPAGLESPRPESSGPGEPAAEPPVAMPAELPSSDRWRRHLRDELLPFWTHPAALGDAATGFPTFRCNDGSAFDTHSPCAELADAPDWIKRELGKEYTRMKSRQTFVYGVGFHVTGDPTLLEHARAGVQFLRTHAFQRDTGSAISYWQDGQAGPSTEQRTSQDLAYAQLGLAFYYYLTRDPEVLEDLLRLQSTLFRDYFEPSWGMLRWVREDSGEQRADQQELVAQLDQINAYMLLLTPLLDEPLQSEWRRDLVGLARVIMNRYFAPEHGLFWGALHSAERMQLGTQHTDFGHTSKSLWMIRMVGTLAGDAQMVEFADQHLPPLAKRAYNSDTGCWGSSVSADGEVQRWSSWWTSAELDQAVATLSLSRPALVETYLVGSYRCWLEGFVDHEHGGVWPFLAPNGQVEGQPAKTHHWKNGYHEAEHALIALITTAALRHESLPLYFAFKQPPADELIQPYLYRATLTRSESVSLPAQWGLQGRRVTFSDIHP